MRTRPVRTLIALFVVALSMLLAPTPPVHARVDLPARLSDAEFWNLTETLSEENGYFRSDNFLSNEWGYQTVIPDLVSRVRPGAVYMGVAPEVNFTYIANLKPALAFIVDIRRGNLHEHLLYKALFEMSPDRVEFLSKLFSRPRPTGLTADTAIEEIFSAYMAVEPSEAAYRDNLKAVMDWLTIRHGFTLRAEDPDGIAYVYREAFFKGGPYLDYSFGSAAGMGGRNSPTYQQLMVTHDGTGRNRGFLASEEHYAWIRDFESRNLLVPVVGDFAGAKAIRGIGRYIREHGGTVGAFYLSNVEQYLNGPLWPTFCANVATLPLDDTSTYIFSGRGGPNGTGGWGRGGMGNSRIRPIKSEVEVCK